MTPGRLKPASAQSAILIWLLGVLLVLGAAPRVCAETYITIGDVPVDVTAKSAAAARDQAIADAQRKAFDRLVKRIVVDPADQARLHPGQAEIESLVQDFGVQSERVSTVRYIGTFTVRFRAGLVRKYFTDAGVGNIGSIQQVVVIPIFRSRSGDLLWGQANPWRAAWDRGGFGDGPVTLILPNADAVDSGLLSVSAAESGDAAAIAGTIQRYAATGLVVAIAEPRDPAKGAASGLAIEVATYDMTGARGSQTLTVDPGADEVSEKVLLSGVSIVARSLEDAWQQAIATSGSVGLNGQATAAQGDAEIALSGPPVTYRTSMQLDDAADWVRTRDRLTAIAGISRVSLEAISRAAAAFAIDYAGDIPSLQAALANDGYNLLQVAPADAAGPGMFQLRRGDGR